MKRILAIGIILLFIGMSISSSTGFNVVEQSNTISNGKTLYVGGSGPGNYTKIQDAIDNASDGDTVFVYNGYYREDVVINKVITLMGEDNHRPWINSDSIGVTIIVDNVVVCGFYLEDCGYYGIYMNYSNNNKIYNNIIVMGGQGIAIYNSDGNEIYSNIIYFGGICLKYSNLNEIHNNSVSLGDVGIQLTKSNNNKICYNEIFDHKEHQSPSELDFGIIINESNFTNIVCNNFHNNDVDIYCINSNENNIVKNVFLSCGIYLYVSYFNIFNYNNLDTTNPYVSFYYIRPNIIFSNNWNHNYWGGLRHLPRPIIGIRGPFHLIPWINFDWYPAKEPFDIEV